MRISLLLSLVFFLSAGSAVAEDFSKILDSKNYPVREGAYGTEEIPPPPDGYTWHKVLAIKAHFLKPKGWHFKSKTEKGTIAYFISKEKIVGDKLFQTGMSVNVIRNVKDKVGVTPYQYAKSMLVSAQQSFNLFDVYDQKAGPFHAIGFKHAISKPPLDLIMAHQILSNTQTGTIYMMFFESPRDTWDEAWKLGDLMLRYNVLNPQF